MCTYQALLQQQECMRSDLQIRHQDTHRELSGKLDREAVQQEEEHVKKMEEGKHKALRERESQLTAKMDATTLNEEDRKQVCVCVCVRCEVTFF